MSESQVGEISNRVRWTALMQRALDICTEGARRVSGLSLTQSRVLFHLAVYPGKRPGSIARSLNLHTTTAASAIDAVCARGYAQKSSVSEPGRGNRPGVQISLTDEGYAQLPRYIAGFEEVFAGFAEELGGADVLEGMLAALLPDGTISMVETCIDDTTLKPGDIYERLHVPESDDPKSALFDKAMYVEKIAWSLEEIDRRDELGANRKERLILRALADLGGSAEVRALRKGLSMKATAMSTALGGLQGKDYISREDVPDNRRVVVASLTGTGRDAQAQTRAGYEAVFDECFPGLAERPVPELR